MGEIGRSAEKAFYSFVDFIADTLGFRVTKETKKEDVGKYFSGLGEKIGKASEELEAVAGKAAADIDKDGLLSKTIREAVDAARTTLSVLKGHLEALKDTGDSKSVVEDQDSQSGASSEEELKKAYNALKGIVGIAKAQQVEALKESSVATVNTQLGVTSAEDGAKVLTTGSVAGAVGDKASLIVSAVNGEAMLDAIVKSEESDAGKGVANSGAAASASALAFAKGNGTHTNIANTGAKAAAVSGGIALRLLTKSGKLAAYSGNDGKAVQSAGITAVNKLLIAVESIIKKTVKNVLGTAKQKIDNARNSQVSTSESDKK